MPLFPVAHPFEISALRRLAAGRTLLPYLPQVPRFRIRTAVPLLAASLALAACGGGGDGGGSSSETGPGATPSCIQTHDQGCVTASEFEERADAIAGTFAEQPGFENQWGLELIRADQAYANLELRHGPGEEPGTGVTVGVLDTGIDRLHPQFRNKRVVERYLPGAINEDGSRYSHGTAVASVIAGQDSPVFRSDAHGVAPGADLVVFALPLGSAAQLYRPISLAGLASNNAEWETIVDAIAGWRNGSRTIDFLNLSLGNAGIINNYGEAELRQHFDRALAAMAQEDSEEKIIFVWSAGNANGLDCIDSTPQCVDGKVNAESVEVLPGLVARIPELQDHTVSVVSVREEDGAISDFSNRCGIAANYCMAAPGESVRVAYFGPHPDFGYSVYGVGSFDGTSFAAPMVTGGLALMKHYFRDQLSNTDLLARLLRTADRSGQYADAAIYGRGLLDLGAATSPVGSASVALGNRVDGPGVALASSQLHLGAAFGDGLRSMLSGRQFAAFDALGAPFWYEFGDLASGDSGPSMAERLRGFQQAPLSPSPGSPAGGLSIPLLDWAGASATRAAQLSLAVSGPSAEARASHLAFEGRSLVATLPATAGLTATAVTANGIAGQEPASGAALSWRPPKALLGLRAGWMTEQRTLLGTETDGAFGSVEGQAVFAGIEADTKFGPWRLGATAEIGSVSARSHGGLLRDISPLSTSAFALHADRPVLDGSSWRVSLSQPLRVESGRALLDIPSGRTKAGDVIRSDLSAGLEPSGRQLDLALQWQRPLDIGVLRVGTTLSRESGHRRNASDELILLSGLHLPL